MRIAYAFTETTHLHIRRLLELTRRAARGADRWTALQHGYAKPILRFASMIYSKRKAPVLPTPRRSQKTMQTRWSV
nr:MAG TPA: hypothetical protein [Caudoviricetes sp.]